DWDDQQLYLHARKINAGFIQSIVYNEYLPAMGVPLEPYQGYDSNVNAQLANLFTAAAFRLGHTLVNSNIQRVMDDGTMHPDGPLTLQDVFFNPFVVMDDGGLDPFLKGMALQMQQEFDAKIIDDVRNFLFGHPGAGGLDLASINISRGRERGLPDLNTIRRELGLTPYVFFRQLNISNVQLTNRLMANYLNINRIDPWVGLLAERRVPGSLFGETLLTILQRQFTALRDGDRFFYLNDPVLTDEEKEMITKTTFHDIIMRNTDITLMQDNVFGAIPLDQICDNMTVEVLGNVRTETGVPVSQVGIDLRAGSSFITLATGEDGDFNFAALPGCDEKTIQLYKVDDHDNGLSTLDLIIVQKHILNREMLDSPYKMLAADVDMSGRISTLDLINMRKVILSIDLTLNDNTPWRFIPADFEFTDPTNPFQDAIPGYMDLTEIGVDYTQDFIAVKLGDVNGSANPAGTNTQFAEVAPRSGKTLNLRLADQSLQAGQTYDININAAAYKQLGGYQFGFRFDANALEILDLNGQLDNLTEGNFAVFNEEGFLASSWNTTNGEGLDLDNDQQIFTMRIQAKTSGRLSEFLQLDRRQLKPEAYNDRLQTSAIKLDFVQPNSFVQNFELYQNQPNPFSDNTSIRFYLPSAEQVDLTIFDASGRIVVQQRQNFQAGQQEWIVDQNQLSSGGVYYYRVATKAGAATKKMVLARD
ncbi:MAG: peroxidase family protein, partial [Bacteroidota bacterium]